MALFAFSCNYIAELSIFRRLFNESYANVAADIESQVKQIECRKDPKTKTNSTLHLQKA